MADLKISQLGSIVTVVPATDVLPVVQGATTYKMTPNQILGSGGVATLASATITGAATVGTTLGVTGDLTVDTNVLKVNTTTNRVGINTTTPNQNLEITGSGNPLSADGTSAVRLNNTVSGRAAIIGIDDSQNFIIWNAGTEVSETIKFLTGGGSGKEQYRITHGGVFSWFDGASGTRMTLNSTGLGIGVVPSSWGSNSKVLQFGGGGAAVSSTGAGSTASRFTHGCYFDNTNWKYESTSVGASLYEVTGANGGSTHAWYIAPGGTAAANITFDQAMTLDASGNLLVGTTSLIGTERLNVTKTTVGSYLARFINTNTTVDTYGITVVYTASTPNDASHNFLGCTDSTTSRAFIYANGGLGNFSANNVNLSDARTKTDIKPLTSYWNKIKALELVTFKYKDQTHDDDNIGLISQQVESVAPEFVSNDGFGETPAYGVPLKSIYTTDLYHAAIKALQEAMTRIEVLESKLA